MKNVILTLMRGALCAGAVQLAALANDVRNGDFAAGGRFWNVTTPAGLLQPQAKEAAMTVSGGVAALSVEPLRKGGRGMPADVRLWQKVTTLKPGQAYVLSFEARTPGVGSIGTVNVRLGKAAKLPDGNHNAVGGLPITHFDVTDTWTPFRYEFVFNKDGGLKLPQDLDECWLTFAVGNVNTFELREVKLVPAGG